jgi:hypothetical protein
LAYKAHRAITGLRGTFIDPAEQVKEHVKQQILGYRRIQEQRRLAEQQRLQAEANRQHTENLRLERERAEAARQAELEDLAPWEMAEAEAVEAVVEPPPPAPVVNLPSYVPSISGGPKPKNLPWRAEVFDFQALVKAAASDPRFLEFLEPNMVALNVKARELQAETVNCIPGVKGVREQTLSAA